jgi:hypothetical protein
MPVVLFGGQRMFGRSRATETTQGLRPSTTANDSVADAVPIVAAHIDEELLTRKKYFEEHLKKQTEELEIRRAERERALKEDYQQTGSELRKDHFGKLARYKVKLEEKSKREDTVRAEEEAKARSALEFLRQQHKKKEENLKQDFEKGREAREIAERWYRASPSDQKLVETNEAAQRDRELQTISKSEKAIMDDLKEGHVRTMEDISQQAKNQTALWRDVKPLLISALFGGALGLLVTPGPSSANL